MLNLLTVCLGFSQKKEVVNSKLVLTDLIKTRVMLVDTTSPTIIAEQYGNDKNSLTNYLNFTAISYLERTKFNQLINNLMVLADNKKTVISNWSNGYKKLSKEKIKERYTFCDSVYIECYSGDEGQYETYWQCDSTSSFMDIIAIDFYEKWSYNKNNGMIDKEVLAYTPLTLNEKGFLKEIFTIFKEEKYIQEISEKQ
jgi:hypothetical protein